MFPPSETAVTLAVNEFLKGDDARHLFTSAKPHWQSLHDVLHVTITYAVSVNSHLKENVGSQFSVLIMASHFRPLTTIPYDILVRPSQRLVCLPWQSFIKL